MDQFGRGRVPNSARDDGAILGRPLRLFLATPIRHALTPSRAAERRRRADAGLPSHRHHTAYPIRHGQHGIRLALTLASATTPTRDDGPAGASVKR